MTTTDADRDPIMLAREVAALDPSEGTSVPTPTARTLATSLLTLDERCRALGRGLADALAALDEVRATVEVIYSPTGREMLALLGAAPAEIERGSAGLAMFDGGVTALRELLASPASEDRR